MRKYLNGNIIENTKGTPRDRWLMKRKCGMAGSDASSTLELNPYKSLVLVYLDKIDYEISYNNLLKGLKGGGNYKNNALDKNTYKM